MLLSFFAVAPLVVPTAAPAHPASAARAADEVSVRTVEIPTSDKLKLHADYYPPRDTDQRSPGALLVHDAGESRAQLVKIAERLQRQGFAVLAIDLRGHGDSRTEDYDWSNMDEEAREKLWAFTTRDLDAAASWLRGNDQVHSTNLNLIGVRTGCTLAVRHALKDANVRSLGLISPRAEEFGFDLRGDIEELAGLPVYIVTERAERKSAESLMVGAHEAVGGPPFIELLIAKPKKGDSVLEDRKLAVDLAKWLEDKAFPKRGAGSSRGRKR